MTTTLAQGPKAWKNIALNPGDTDRHCGNWMEHRWGPRRPCRTRVCVSAGGGVSGLGRLANISMSGALLETAVPLPLFAQLAITVLREDGATHQLEFTAVVVRHESNGVGIEWCDPNTGSICQALHCDIDCALAGRMPK
jgi:hypothetical protein